MKLSLIAVALLLCSLGLAQVAPVVVHRCEDLSGVSLGQGRDVPQALLEIVSDPARVSEGKGAIHAVSASKVGAQGNSYLSVILTTPPVDTRGKALVFEASSSTPTKSLALYARGYDAKGQCVLSFNSWSGPLQATKATFTLTPGVSDADFAWEPDMVKSEDRSAVVKWEFYTGTHDAETVFDFYLDNLRLEVATARSFLDVAEPHALRPDTPLGQALIVAPADPAWQAPVQTLAEALGKATGAKPEIRTGDKVTNDDLAGTEAILLGNVTNNRAFLYPYMHLQAFADGVFPGAGGYELRTAQDPWGKGHNLLIIGASDVAGLQAGVTALAAQFKPGANLTVGRLCEVKLGGEAARQWGNLFTQNLDDAWFQGQQKSANNALEQGGHTGLFSQIASVGENYALTGREPYARLYVWLAKRAYEWYLTKPTTFGGPWGMDSDFPSHRVIPAWDVVEECPTLTPEERLEVSRILFRYISDAALPEGGGAAGGAKAGRLVSNHGTFAALGTFAAGEFFSKYYQSVEAKRWIAIGDTTFQNLAKGSKVHEDCNGYQWLTQYHIVRYALTKPDLTYFENGNARKAADFAMLTMNNLGYQVPYGDTGAWVCWFSEMPVLRACEWFYRDGRYQWAINKKLALSQRPQLGQLDPAGATKVPVDLVGGRAWPLDAIYHHEGGASAPPLDKCVDKVAFRNGLEPADQYLLLDGLSNGGHRHMDGNAVLQWTEKDRVWLADADYIKSLPKYHNGVLILKDGQSATIPNFVEMENYTDLPGFAGSVTTMRNYAGVDWRRHVLWLKGQAFIVVDQMVAREAGDYSFRAVWQTVGETEIKDNGLDIDQHGQFARFAMTADARCLVSDDPDTGKNWSSYPHADKPIVRVFQGVCNQRLAAGQRFSLFTVLHASGDKPSPVRVKRLNSNRALVEGLGEPLLVALPDQTGAIPFVEGVSAKAAALIFSSQKAYALGVTEMPMVPAEQLGPTGADAEIDLRTGQINLKSPLGAGATTVQQLRTVTQPAPAPAAEVAGFLKMLAAAAPATVSPGGGLQGLAPLKSLWTYRQKLAAYALTNNASIFEAVDTGLKLTCSPQPLEHNVFGDAPTNTLDNLADGVLLTTDGGVMWDTGQAVTLTLEFDNVYDVGKLDLRSWFATQSSRGKTYQLGQLQVLASNDGFKQDTRKLVDFTDDKTYGNWGNPNYGPQLYTFGDLKAKARQLRLILTPRPGSGIYLSELIVWGSRPGLENVLAQRKSGAPAHLFEATLASDLTGDKQTELLAGSSSGAVYCFSPQGDLKWQYEAGVKVNCLGAVDYQGNGQRTVLVGTADARMIALDATGKELWTFRPPYYKRAGHPRTIFPADLQGNGKQVAICGAENWHYYAVDATGKMIWKYESVHGSTAGTAADLNGDKKDEIVAGTEYYWWHVINPDGSRRFGFNTSGGPCANAVATGNLLGDGQRAALFGGADTLVQVMSADGKLQWAFNTGDEVTGLACADVNGDGKDEVLVSSLSFNVYCLDGAGKMLWRQDLGDQVRALTVWQSQGQWLVGAGTDSKQVVVLQARDGKPLGGVMVADKVLGLTPVGAQANELAVTVADGNLVVVAAPGN